MNVIVQFLRDNWRDLLVIVIALVTLVVNLIKRKVNINDVLSVAYSAIPDLVSSAEAKYGAGHGEDKFKFVFQEAILLIATAGNLNASEACKKYGVLIQTFIESCLSTPTKKEVKL